MLLLTSGALVESSGATVVCRDGTALFPIVVSPEAPGAVNEAAHDLADYLGRIGGAEFNVIRSRADEGISLRVESDPERPEHYTIRPHSAGVRIVGASELAISHAVWDFLYRLGYRQYFPSDTWEIVPQLTEIRIDREANEQPDYDSRLIWYGYGTNPWNADLYQRWITRNRMGGDFELNTGHAWNDIVRRHREVFDQHAEWLALVDGRRVTPDGIEKFCVSNEALRRFVVQDVLTRARANPELDSISLDPSDGSGWCECEACAEIGTPSNRVILLANDAAAALEDAGHHQMRIGVYAYAEHARGPTIKPHPAVIVSIATAFSDRTPDELLSEWHDAGVNQVGIREYHSLFVWDSHFPGASRSSNSEYLARTIPRFHRYGARFYTSETGDAWSSEGFGHFLSARTLWDISEAARVDEIRSRFVSDCFGPAAEPMAAYFELVDGKNNPLISKDLIGRMYRQLSEARDATSDAAVHARLNDLTLYTRFVELMHAYRQGNAGKGVDAIRFAWRMRKTGMVHSYAIYRELADRGPGISVPEGAGPDDPEEANPWKSSEPFTSAELEKFVTDGIANNPLFDFRPRQFLGPLRRAGLVNAGSPFGDFGPRDRYDQSWLIWMDRPGTLRFKAQTGIIPSYRHVRDTRFELHTIGQPIDNCVDFAEVGPDGRQHNVVFKTRIRGLHRLTMSDAGAMTTLSFPSGIVVTREAGTSSPLHLNAGARLYFYVPRGTKKIGGYSDTDDLRIFSADQSWNDGQNVGPGYFAIDVPEGKDESCWRVEVRSSGGDLILMTVPPYVSRSPEQLLLPRGVIGQRIQ